MRDSVLIELAGSNADSIDALQKISGLGDRIIARAGDQLLHILAAAASTGSAYQPPPRLDESKKALLNEMQRRVSGCASELGIAAEIIAPKKELSAVMQGAGDSRVFKGWRRELIGEDLLTLVDGA